ncbi:MAG: peptidylprolyl isomerase [Thermoplasmatota archaeon]
MRALGVIGIAAVMLVLVGCTTTTNPNPGTSGQGNLAQYGYAKFTTNKGSFEIRFVPAAAPKTVAHIQSLVAKGFYSSIPFHRYVAGFVIQWGDPNCIGNVNAANCGAGGSGNTTPLETSSQYTHTFGAVGLARSSDPNSGDSQLYIVINQSGAHELDGQYTVLGYVQSGMLTTVMNLRQGDVVSNATLEKNATSTAT